MHSNKIEDKIIEKIQEITKTSFEINNQVCLPLTNNKRDFRIKKILIFSSSFDFFLLEEEGRLRNLFSDWSKFSEQYNPPTITHVEHRTELFESLEKSHFDLILIFNTPQDISIEQVTKKIKEKTKTPIALLHNNIKELNKARNKFPMHIDNYFTWNGDGKIIISIVHYFEDKINIESQEENSDFKCILLIEDSIQFYSSYFTIYTEELYKYLNKVITKDINCEQRELRFHQRPFFIHIDTYDEAIRFYHSNKKNIQFIISDNYLETNNEKKQIGIELANGIATEEIAIPILIQSSEPINKEKVVNSQVKIISKSSAKLMTSIRCFFRNNLGPYKIIISNKKKEEVLKIDSINDLKTAIEDLDANVLMNCAKKFDFSRWLYSIGEIEYSSKCKIIEKKCNNSKELKTNFFEMIEQYQYAINQTAISSFSQYINDPMVKLSRIGEGALGGKARGLAFMAKIMSKYRIQDLFPTLKITIPRSIVLSTDVFDMFMDHNHLTELDFYHLSDERISSKFVKASLPPTVLGDLRSFIRNTRKPLIIRSSGLLEDSLMQPFAGIYASMLLPNDSWETDLRFQEVCNAIKHVFSSTYFEQARTYIKNTPKHLADEKMAVLIQEIVGDRHGNYFYPTISGVAKSYNYYPSSSCKPEDGIAYLALGLGKSIVDGGSSFAFCPVKPKKPLFGTAKEYMKYAQQSFYALNLRSIYKYVNVNEETSLDKLDLDTAKKHGVLDKVVSTYIYQDDQIYPGLYDGGSHVIDFGPIINYNMIPLSKAINLLLNISEIVLGYPVEIEFAVNVSNKDEIPSELIILQIRSMIPPDKEIDVNIDEIHADNIIISTENCLGYGIASDIYDIVYVDQDLFDMSKSIQVVEQIRKINEKLMDSKTPYMLIGPGRWGSFDQWLGIPVLWSNIAGAKAIVEIPYKERHIDPSQGSHFFHDMIASNVMYLITKKEEDVDWNWIKNQQTVEKTDFIRHVRTSKPFKIIVDGKKGKGIVIQ
jgi:pyruvate phosphate dikinase-like enzyme